MSTECAHVTIRCRVIDALALTLVLAWFGAAQPVRAGASVGSGTPDFSGVESDGARQRISDYRGNTVVREWTNHDCPYMRKHYSSGNMQALQRKAVAEGLVRLSVISSAPGKLGHVSSDRANELTVGRSAAPTAVILGTDGRIGRMYGAKTPPHMYVIDSEGTFVYMGSIDDRPTSNAAHVSGARKHVRAALAELAAGQAVSRPVTRPYVCSVKY